jgi:phosphoglycolate phosphatase-like HAD superfamily hydrolase
MPQAAIFDVDGTLVDSVDLHASAWQEALVKFGHQVTFEQARSQIGKGGDQLIPVFLTEAERRDHGAEMEEWRGKLFKSKYLPLVRPFSAVPELLRRVREAGLRVAVASSAKSSEVEVYLDIAGVKDLVDIATSSEDAEHSKPASDIFQVALKKLGLAGSEAVAIGDTPYDAQAAGKAGIPTIGLLCGGFAEADLRKGGCVAVYPGPAALLACFAASPLAMEAPSLGSRREAALLSQDIYQSSNGDRWQLIRETGSGRRFVRHQANVSAGGHVTDTNIDDFLRVDGSGPEFVALRRMLREA